MITLLLKHLICLAPRTPHCLSFSHVTDSSSDCSPVLPLPFLPDLNPKGLILRTQSLITVSL